MSTKQAKDTTSTQLILWMVLGVFLLGGCGIATVLALGFVLPTVNIVTEKAKQMNCSNHLRQLGSATHNHCMGRGGDGELPPYMAWYQGQQPGAIIFSAQVKNPAQEPGSQPMSVFYMLLPYIGEDKLYNSSTPSFVASQEIKAFTCPADTGKGTAGEGEQKRFESNYVANNASFALYISPGQPGFINGKGGSASMRTFADGLSNTFLFSERIRQCEKDKSGAGTSRFTRWAVTHDPRDLVKAQNDTVGCILYANTGTMINFVAPKLTAGNLQAAAKPTDCTAAQDGAWGLTLNSAHPKHVWVCTADGSVKAITPHFNLNLNHGSTRAGLNALYTPATNDWGIELETPLPD